MHPAAAQHQLGEAVVDVRGALDDGAAVPDDLVGPLQAGDGRTGLGEQVGGVDGGRGEGGEGTEQGDLLPFEDPGPPVRGEQDADDVVSEHQGHAEDGDESFVPHAGVDGAGVPETVVAEVVLGDVGAGGLRDQPAEALAHAEPQLLEAGGDRALGDPHVRVAPGRVVQAQVGDVGAEQRTGALHDGPQHGVQVAQSREVVRGLEEGGQLGLAAAPLLQLGPHAQGEQLGLFERGDPLGGLCLGAREQDRLLVGLGGGAAGEQLQERRLGTARTRAGVGVRPARQCGSGGRSLGGLHVIAGHAHRIPHTAAGPAGLWKTPPAGVRPLTADASVRGPAAVQDQ
ncbi:hypothetical protein RKD26_006063 [Streptomyces calvus]